MDGLVATPQPAMSLDLPLEEWIERGGRIVRAYREQDSGCFSFVGDMDGRRAFFKQARSARAAQGLARALRLYEEVRHAVLPGLWGYWQATDGPLLVFEWVSGEPLYDPLNFPGASGRADPRSAHARFRALPMAKRLAAVEAVFDLHQAVAKKGFISRDFYDGSILYDFESDRTWVIDTDEYHEGCTRVGQRRGPGSTRFMAPEEFEPGALLDERTMVYHMGRTALVLLGDGSGDLQSWSGEEARRQVLERAVAADPAGRYGHLHEFLRAWRESAAQPKGLAFISDT
jgi:serine/threonine-protein kinase